MNWNQSLFAVLGGIRPNDHMGPFVVKAHIAPHELLQLAEPKAGVSRRDVKRAMLPGDQQNLVQFVIRKRPALALLAARIDRRDTLQRIALNPLLSLHPIHEHAGRIEIIVERLWRSACLPRTPHDKAVGSDVGKILPIAFLEKAAHPRFHLPPIDF